MVPQLGNTYFIYLHEITRFGSSNFPLPNHHGRIFQVLSKKYFKFLLSKWVRYDPVRQKSTFLVEDGKNVEKLVYTLDSGIDVRQGKRVGPGKFGIKNKSRALNTHVICSK